MKKSKIIGVTAFIIIGLLAIVLIKPKVGDENQTALNNLTPVKEITHSHGLSVDPFDETRVYIATHHGLFVLINDTDLYQIGKSKDDYMGFSAHTSQPGTFYSSGHYSYGGNIGFQKSEDGGVTWNKLSAGVGGPVDFHAMAVSPADPNIIYGWYQGRLQKSTDGGKSWAIANDNILVVQLTAHPTDANVVYGASPSGEGILMSKDGGSNWELLSADLKGGQISAIAVNPASPEQMLTYSEKLEGLAISEDGGIIWKKSEAKFDGVILYISFFKIDPRIVYAMTHTNTLYKSDDGGVTWKVVLKTNS